MGWETLTTRIRPSIGVTMVIRAGGRRSSPAHLTLRWLCNTVSWSVAEELYDHLVEDTGEAVDQGWGQARARPGDVLFYNLRGPDGNWDHTAIVTRVSKYGIYVAQHAINYERLFSTVVNELNAKIGRRTAGWVVHFVRPIHTQANIP